MYLDEDWKYILIDTYKVSNYGRVVRVAPARNLATHLTFPGKQLSPFKFYGSPKYPYFNAYFTNWENEPQRIAINLNILIYQLFGPSAPYFK